MSLSCVHYVASKGRYCRLAPLPGKAVCIHHLADELVQETKFDYCVQCKTRIAHLRFQKHLQKCPVRRRLQESQRQVYYNSNLNVACEEVESSNPGYLDSEQFQILVEKIRQAQTFCRIFLHNTNSENVSLGNTSFEHNNQGTFSGNTRDLLQCRAIASTLEDFIGGKEVSGDVLVELCAGRANLSAEVMKKIPFAKVVLIDRRPYRFKADRSLRRQCDLHRLTIDLKDLDLYMIPALHSSKVTVVGKHLCGEATDFALTCCLSRVKETQSAFHGMLIAPCCHHSCKWDSFVNRPFLEQLGFSESDFHHLVRLSGWASISQFSELRCDRYVARSEQGAEMRDRLTDLEKSKLGLQVKLILNVARVVWCQQNGLNVRLQEYVQRTVTPENQILLIWS